MRHDQPQLPRQRTVVEALDAIQRPASDRDGMAQVGTAGNTRWLARIDKIEAVLALVRGQPEAIGRTEREPRRRIASYRGRTKAGVE